MKNSRDKSGVTLIEMLVAVALIVLLASIVIGIAGRTDDKAKEQLTRNTFALLDAALEQFNDYGYRYKSTTYSFPLDCSLMIQGDAQVLLQTELGVAAVDPAGWLPGELWCFFLSRIPASREILGKVDESLKTSAAITTLGVRGRVYPFVIFLDPWKMPLRYQDIDNFGNKLHFPLITSAGPDRDFDTVADNITNR